MQDVTLYQNANQDIDIFVSGENLITVFNKDTVLEYIDNGSVDLMIELIDQDKMSKFQISALTSIEHFAQLVVTELPKNVRNIGANVYLNDYLVATTEY